MCPETRAEFLQSDTAAVAAPYRSQYWRDVVARTYSPLDLQFRRPNQFNGRLSLWDLGDVSLSRNTSDALVYRRHRHHFVPTVDEDFLVTVPDISDIAFSQCGTSVGCGPGQFILERSHEPYEFSHDRANDLLVLKIPGRVLRGRVRSPGRFCALRFDATSGIGGLFVDMLRLVPQRFVRLTPAARRLLGSQLADLLALAVTEDARTLTAGLSSVRDAHLARIESYVRRNLFAPDLNPERVAAACGISIRYLHQLFHGTGQTLGEWIRDQRLLTAREALADAGSNLTIAEITQRCGFGDQAQFSRLFKVQFGQTPSEFRRQSRQRQLMDAASKAAIPVRR
jgi:AraC-like DNA-binding protein